MRPRACDSVTLPRRSQCAQSDAAAKKRPDQSTVANTKTSRYNIENDQAVAIADAIDMSIANAQLLTVPVFETRMTRVESELALVNLRLDTIDERFRSVNDRFDAAAADVNRRYGEIGKRIEEAAAANEFRSKFLESLFDSKLSSLKYQLIIVNVLTALATSAPKLITAIMSAIHAAN
jgi:hypothetical protein